MFSSLVKSICSLSVIELGSAVVITLVCTFSMHFVRVIILKLVSSVIMGFVNWKKITEKIIATEKLSLGGKYYAENHYGGKDTLNGIIFIR